MTDDPCQSSSDATGVRRTLLGRWPLPDQPALRDALLDAWAAPERGYHDLTHLLEVLTRLGELADEVGYAAPEVQLAAWFHDAVYDGDADPEGRSAEWARRALAAARDHGKKGGLDGVMDGGVRRSVDVDEVVRLVLLTRDHSPAPEDLNGVALCDADLAVLASAPARYAAYAAGVRREYRHLDDTTFTAGRLDVLRTFLAREHLFTSAVARARWEAAARRNAAREVAELESRR